MFWKKKSKKPVLELNQAPQKQREERQSIKDPQTACSILRAMELIDSADAHLRSSGFGLGD